MLYVFIPYTLFNFRTAYSPDILFYWTFFVAEKGFLHNHLQSRLRLMPDNVTNISDKPKWP